MEKVLIISYFFPPCNRTASQRAGGWAKYLKEYGYQPIVVTRDWSHEIRSPQDILKQSGDKEVHEINEHFEVYRLPYNPGLRDRINTSFAGTPLQVLSKPITFINEFLGQFTKLTIPHRNLLSKAEELIKAEGITKVVISANPFDQFLFGYILRKQTGIKWIADYRDDWTTTELFNDGSFKSRLKFKLSSANEKKWVSTAAKITSVSPKYTEKISSFVRVPGETILNGFDLPDDLPVKTPIKGHFTITYNGSLYPTQPIDPVLEVIRELIEENTALDIQLKFPGLAYDPDQKERVLNLFKGFEDHIMITERIPRSEVLQIQMESDLFLMVSHENIKGVPSSKLYEYISLKKPVLLYPNDEDIIEETLSQTGLGIICADKSDIKSELKNLIDKKYNEAPLITDIDDERINSYSRRRQTKKLAEILDSLDEQQIHTQCLHCFSTNLEPLQLYKHAHLCQCANCGFVFSQGIPTEQVLYDYYKEEYERNDYFSPITLKRYNEILDKIEPYRKTGRLMDVGTGIGFFAEEAIKRGWEVHGVELTDEAIEICEAKGIKMIKGKIDPDNYAPESFDIITSFEVIEHINNPIEELENYQKILRKGGVVYVTTPNFNSLLRYRLKEKYNVITYPEHLSYYTPKTLKAVFRRCGFKTKKLETTGISLTRLRTSQGKSDQEYVSETSDDEIMRLKIEDKWYLQFGKIVINKTLTIFGKGDSLKGWFVKE